MSVKFHTLRQRQWIPQPIDRVFEFFAEARNLEQLTPPWLKFRILHVDAGPLHAGSEIRYRLRVHYVPIYWRTEIRHWNPPYSFVDVERAGPYRLWHHTHKFESVNGGTQMSDVVRYQLPLGIVGRLVHALQVRRDVQQIFDYRRGVIEKLFGAGA
jgi:ligand-binding SRPBCC domain-containing protein